MKCRILTSVSGTRTPLLTFFHFPSDNLGSQRTGVSGDIAVCSVVVQTEAQEQNKAADAHWAHIIIHGVLHLCGYDHITDAVATDMESLEVLILRQLGFPAPYQLRLVIGSAYVK